MCTGKLYKSLSMLCLSLFAVIPVNITVLIFSSLRVLQANSVEHLADGHCVCEIVEHLFGLVEPIPHSKHADSSAGYAV